MTPRPLASDPRMSELSDRPLTGIALADVSSVWQEILKSKTYLDFTGNGVNHPNDFGHRVYAEVILASLIKDFGK